MRQEAQRRTLLDEVGSALSVGRDSGSVVSGLGAAALHVHHGADRRGLPVATVVSNQQHQVDPQDAIAAELGSLLAHIRYGRHHSQIPRAVDLFARYMAFRSRFAKLEDRELLLPRLAARAMHEYLSDKCTRCGGTGRLEQLAGGTLVRGTGRMARNAIFRTCPVNDGCGGTGRPLPSHTQRRIALGLDLQRYESEGWGATVKAAICWLERLQHRMRGPLTVQLERRKKRV